MSENTTLTKRTIALWVLAILVVFAMLFIVGWDIFYGFVVPQANNISQFSSFGLFAFAALAGLMVNFGPCSLAVLPAYLSFHLGLEEDADELEHPLAYGLTTGLTAAVGVVGFYLILGLIFAGFGTELAAYSAELKLVVAGLILLLGVALLSGTSIKTGIIEKFKRRIQQITQESARTKGLIGFGVIYAAGGLSCFLPVFLPLVFFPFITGAFATSIVSFLVFSLAQALFLITATVAVAYGKQGILKGLAGKTALMKKIAGWVLVLTALVMFGIFVFLGM